MGGAGGASADQDEEAAPGGISFLAWKGLNAHSRRVLASNLASRNDPVGSAIVSSSASFGQYVVSKAISRYSGDVEPRAKLFTIVISPTNIKNIKLGQFDAVDFEEIVQTFTDAYVVSERTSEKGISLFAMTDLPTKLIIVGRILFAGGVPESTWQVFSSAVEETIFYQGPGPNRERILRAAFNKFTVDLTLSFKAFSSPMALPGTLMPTGLDENCECLAMLRENIMQGDEKVRRDLANGIPKTPTKQAHSSISASPDESPPRKAAATVVSGAKVKVPKKVNGGQAAEAGGNSVSTAAPYDNSSPGALAKHVKIEGSGIAFGRKSYDLNATAAAIKAKNTAFPLDKPKLLAYALAKGSHEVKSRWIPEGTPGAYLQLPYKGFTAADFIVTSGEGLATLKTTPLNFV